MLQHWPKRDPNKHYYLVTNKVIHLVLTTQKIDDY